MADGHTEEVDERLSEPGLPAPGSAIGEFRVSKPIGVGGCGAVFQAYQERLDRDVAVKVLLPSAASRFDGLAKRFMREIDIVKRLEHPNIVRMYDFGQTDSGLLWMAMELVRGRELAQIIQQGEALEPARVKHMMLQVLSALAEAHELNIVHRDLKPGNIMLTRKGADEDVVKLLDFGIGKALGEGENSAVQNLTTNNGDAYGTPRYMAPELLLKENVGPHVDVYAVGLILYELITGQPAVHGETVYEILARQLQEKIELPSWLAATELGDVIAQATHKEHTERYQTALAFHRALRGCDVSAVDALRSGKISPQMARDTGRSDLASRTDNVVTSTPVTGEVQESPAGIAPDVATLDTPPGGSQPGDSTGPVDAPTGADIPAARPATPSPTAPVADAAQDATDIDDPDELIALMGSGGKSNTGLIIGVGAGVVILLVILVVAFSGDDAETTENKPEEAATEATETETAETQPAVTTEEKVEWRFETTPTGASVQVNGRAVCAATPCSAEIRKLDRQVTVFLQLDGYRSISRTIVPNAPDSIAVEFQEKLDPNEHLEPGGQLLDEDGNPIEGELAGDGDTTADDEAKKTRRKKRRDKRLKVPNVVD